MDWQVDETTWSKTINLMQIFGILINEGNEIIITIIIISSSFNINE